MLVGRLAYAADARDVYASEVTIVLFGFCELRLNHPLVLISGQEEAHSGGNSPIEVQENLQSGGEVRVKLSLS